MPTVRKWGGLLNPTQRTREGGNGKIIAITHAGTPDVVLAAAIAVAPDLVACDEGWAMTLPMQPKPVQEHSPAKPMQFRLCREYLLPPGVMSWRRPR